ncbi:MAG: hypothetical protein K8T91_05775 [Planctomycetes bacterium]|nr:hypothetical protein [Planctomycetota bacterium]
MDVSGFLGGSVLTQLDLLQPCQVWTIGQVKQQLVGTDPKIAVTFVEFSSKPLALNKINLRRLAQLYGTHADNWVGKPLVVYRSMTSYQGQSMPCVRVCGPQQVPPDLICDQRGNPVVYQNAAPQVGQVSAAAAASVAAPQFAQPVTAPRVNPVVYQPVPPQQPQVAWSPAPAAPPQEAIPQAGQQPVAAPHQPAVPAQPQATATPWENKNGNSPPSA